MLQCSVYPFAERTNFSTEEVFQLGRGQGVRHNDTAMEICHLLHKLYGHSGVRYKNALRFHPIR